MGLNQVAVWLKQIIAAVFLAGFLEMLLPNNELKGATRLIMGLLIMIILVQPLTRLLKMPTEILWSMPETIIDSQSPRGLPSADDLIKQGKRLQKQWAKAQAPGFEQNARVTLEDKLRTMMAMIDGVTLRGLTAVYRSGERAGARELTGLIVKVAPALGKNNDSQFKQTVERQIYQSVALFSNLPKSGIEVQWDGGTRAGD